MPTANEDYENTILGILRKMGTVTANHIARRTNRKQETAKRYLDKLELKGLVYSTKSGKTTYFTLMPNGNHRDPRPDRRKMESKNEVYAHPSLNIPFRRAKTHLEIINEKGFVCHPSIKGSEVDRTFMRCHFNGEYQVSVRKKGDMRSVDYLADTDVRIWWKKNGLNTNVSCICEIRVPNDPEPFKLRTVSGKDGKFRKVSIWVHPRYIYYIDCTKTSEAEFEQQVKDVLAILNQTGWEFKDDITKTGQPHNAFNDRILGGLVGNYNEKPTDPLHFDHSHGINECEVYGNDNPEVIEVMVNLPTIMKTFSNALLEMQSQMTTMLDIQTKQFTFLNNKIDGSVNVSTMTNDDGMYR